MTLITRPCRFGKTLVMSMLSAFYDIRGDSREWFEGLSITEDKELCEKWKISIRLPADCKGEYLYRDE